jgi:hypothetical protein
VLLKEDSNIVYSTYKLKSNFFKIPITEHQSSLNLEMLVLQIGLISFLILMVDDKDLCNAKAGESKFHVHKLVKIQH